MKERLLTSLGLTIVLVLAFVLKIYVSAYFFDFFIVILGLLGGIEIAKLLTKMGKYNHSEIVAIFPVILCVGLVLCLFGGLGYYSLLVGLALIVVFTLGVFLFDLVFRKATRKEMRIREVKEPLTKFAFKKAINTMCGFVYPAFLLSTMILLNHFEILSSVGDVFPAVSVMTLLFAFLIPIFTDTFAMFTGSLLGGKKLCPKISPGKTISGAIGGAVCAVILCASLFLMLNQIESIAYVLNAVNLGINNIWKLIIIVLVGSVISQVGDVYESYLKRKAGVKDTGRILPGHGGILDRFDSYIFLAPYLLVAFLILFI